MGTPRVTMLRKMAANFLGPTLAQMSDAELDEVKSVFVQLIDGLKHDRDNTVEGVAVEMPTEEDRRKLLEAIAEAQNGSAGD